MKKINILQLITGLGMGGAEKVVLDLAKYTNREKFSTYVVSMSKRDELYQEYINNKINTTILNKNNSITDIFSIVIILNKFIKKNNINIIHAHLTHSIIVASILKIFNPSLKIVFTSHSLNIGSKLREFIVKLIKPLRNIDIIFSKDILKSFYKSNYKVIPNGVNIEKYSLKLQKYEKFTFISVGRLETVKNHKSLLEIVNELKNDYDFELHLVGDGYLKEELKIFVKNQNLEKYVKFLGLRNDIPELLNKSHCFLLPSLWEGFPIVILEASASKLPIISTPVGSIPSLLNSSNATLSNIENFKNHMIEIITNYNNAMNKSNNLFSLVNEKYSITKIIKKHEEIYYNLLIKG